MLPILLSGFLTTCSHFSRFCSDTGANVAPIFAIAIIPIVGLTGSAMDYTRANSIKSAMQAAADATALKLVQNALSLPSGDVSATADPVFKASFSRPDAAQLQISAQSTSSGVVTVTATAQMATDFMGVLGITNIVIGSRTVAMKTPGDGKGCVLALNRSASGTITAQGRTTINLNACSMYDNSRSSTALTVRRHECRPFGQQPGVDRGWVRPSGGAFCRSGRRHFRQRHDDDNRRSPNWS